MRDLLVQTGNDWALRTSRTQALGAAAAKSDVVAAWLADEPGSVDALVMTARVAAERALHAARQHHSGAGRLAQAARAAGKEAALAAPADPVPWICLLALAQVDVRQELPEHRQPPPPPEALLPDGPWTLLREASRRDTYNREAFHRMLQFLYARTGGTLANALDYARWVDSWAPEGSPLLALPLYAYAEHYRDRRTVGGSSDNSLILYWSSEHVSYAIKRALYGWFDASEPDGRSLLDLSHLAHALWGARWFDEAARVFRALGPFATPVPWRYAVDDPGEWQEEFMRARQHCLAAAPDE